MIDRAEEQQRVLEQRRDALGDELVERVDVVRQPADDDAGAVALVVAEREALEVAEEAVAEIGEDALSRPAGEVRLRGVRAEVDEARGDERADDPAERREIALRDAVVDRELRQVRRRQRGERREEQEAERERDAALVRLGEPCERGQAAAGALPAVAGRRRLAALDREVGAGLPDPHAVASTRAANSASSSPCSYISR